MNKKNNKTQHRRLSLKTETVVYLTDDLLKHVVGGEGDVTNSTPISKCNTQCLVKV